MTTTSSVLIVEDDVLIATALEDAFADAGFTRIGFVTNTADAMASLRAQSPAVLVLDVALADSADGWGLAEVANQVCAPPPVIIFSTGQPHAIPAWAAEAGSVVPKPSSPDDVVAVAVKALKARGFKGTFSGLLGRLKP